MLLRGVGPGGVFILYEKYEKGLIIVVITCNVARNISRDRAATMGSRGRASTSGWSFLRGTLGSRHAQSPFPGVTWTLRVFQIVVLD